MERIFSMIPRFHSRRGKGLAAGPPTVLDCGIPGCAARWRRRRRFTGALVVTSAVHSYLKRDCCDTNKTGFGLTSGVAVLGDSFDTAILLQTRDASLHALPPGKHGVRLVPRLWVGPFDRIAAARGGGSLLSEALARDPGIVGAHAPRLYINHTTEVSDK